MKISREKDSVLKAWIWKADFRYRKKRYRLKAFSKSELEDLIIKTRRRADAGDTALLDAPVTIGVLHEKYRSTLPNDTGNQRWKITVLSHFVDFINADKLVTDVMPADLNDYALSRRRVKDAKRNAAPLSAQTYNKELSIINQMFKAAPSLFRSLTHYVPPRVAWRKTKSTGKKRRLTDQEITTLLDFLRAPQLRRYERLATYNRRFRLADMFEFALLTAIRWGEMAKLKWHYVDLRRRTIQLPASVAKNRSDRLIYLNSRAAALVERLRNAAPRGEYLFPNHDGTSNERYYYHTLRNYALQLGLDFGAKDGFTLHTTRHTAVSLVMERSGDFAAAQALAGHTDARMTALYSHTSPESVKRAAELTIDAPVTPAQFVFRYRAIAPGEDAAEYRAACRAELAAALERYVTEEGKKY